jgi:murein tripeptide amidase MpaA
LILLAAMVWGFGQPAAAEPPVRYDNHAVVRAQLTSPRDVDTMLSVTQDHWSESVGIGAVDFRVSPEGLERLEASGIRYQVLIEDIQPLIDAERERLSQGRGAAAGGGWFDDYKDYDAVNADLEDLVALRPDLAEILTVGTSLEGRTIYGIRITGPGANKPAVLLNGCQHAREWIAVMVPIYVADRLVRDYDIDPVVRDLVNRVEFLIIPIVNPDGYVYSWGPDRMWRKNRRHNGNGIYGVDLNRNWDFEWGGQGSSGNPNSQTYRGPQPFSEPETQAMRDFYEARPQIVSNIDFHSYSQLVLAPWGYTSDLPPDHDELDELGGAMASLIFDVHGKNYIHGPVYTILYPASGISIDWTYGDQGVFSYTIELRPVGSPGFILPPEEIIPNSEEIFPAMLHLAEWSAEGVIIGDLNGDGSVGIGDLLMLLAEWGPCPDPPAECPADLDGDGNVGINDLLILLANWG